jgi:DedD protein
MAKAVTDEQLQLRRRARRRLIGAIALVTVIAVVLPWVLDSEPQPTGPDVSVQIPSPNAGEFTTRVAPANQAAPARPAADAKAPPQAPPAPEGKGAPEAKPGAETTAGPAAKPVPERKPAASGTEASGPPETLEAEQMRSLTPPLPRSVASADKAGVAKAPPKAPEKAAAPKAREPDAKSAPAPTKAAGDKGFIVQVGALADPEKAKALQQQLAGKGLPTYTEAVETPKGTVTRVRVGPFPTREAAEQSRDRLKSLGHDGNVAPR